MSQEKLQEFATSLDLNEKALKAKFDKLLELRRIQRENLQEIDVVLFDIQGLQNDQRKKYGKILELLREQL